MATLFAPLVAAIGITGTAATLVSTGLALAATTAIQYFLAQGNETKPETGTKLKAQSGGAVPLSMIFGETETAGSFLYGGSWGKSGKTPNGYMVEVFSISDLIVQAQESTIWLDGTKRTIGATEGFDDLGNSMGYKVSDYDGDCWVKLINGATSVDPYLNAKFGSLATRPWEGIGRGRALLVVTCRYNEKEPYGFPAVRTVIKGNKFYDWRLDSTNGGSGSHRYGTRSTYTYDGGNPIIGIYNIMRGIYYTSDVWMFGGKALPKTRFDNDTFTAAANVCDENVTLASAATEKRYRIGSEVNVSQQPLDVVDRWLQSCNGRIVESGGVVKIYAGGIGASVLSITDNDIIVSEPVTGTLLNGYQNTVNTISGTYVEPGNGGQAKAYKSRQDADALAADGETLVKEFSSDCVRSNTQMQRLAQGALKESRRAVSWNIVLPPWARKLEPCDVITWDSDRNGYTSKKFIVGDGLTKMANGLVGLNIREAEPGDQDWSVADEDPYTVGVYGDIVADTQPTTVTVTSTTIKDGSGNDRIPAVKVSWDVDEDDVDCKFMRWEIQQRISGTWTDIDLYGRVEFDTGKTRITEGLQMGSTYRLRAKIVPESNRLTEWTSWTSFTAGSFSRRITTVDLDQTPPTKITDLSVSTRVVITEDGNAQAYAILTFTDPNTEACTYRVRINANGDQTYQSGDTSPIRVPIEAGTEYTFRVLPRSFAGVIPSETNPWSNAVTVTPSDSSTPTTAAGLTATGKPGYIALAWTPCPDKNYAYTEIFRRIEGATFSASDDYLVARIKGSAWNDTGLSYGNTRDYWIRHVNRKLTPGSQNPSGAGRTATVKRVVTDDLDQSAPPDVTGAAVTARIDYSEDGFAVAKAIVSWDMQTEDPGLNYLVRMTGDGGARVLEFNQSPARIPVEAGNAYTFQVKAKRISGVTSDNWKPNTALSLTPEGTSTPSPATGLTVKANPGRVYLDWDAPTDKDHAYFEVHRALSADGWPGTVIGQPRGNTFIDDDPPMSGGNYVNAYYWVSPVNRRLAEGTRNPTGNGELAKARLIKTTDIGLNTVWAGYASKVLTKSATFLNQRSIDQTYTIFSKGLVNETGSKAIIYIDYSMFLTASGSGSNSRVNGSMVLEIKSGTTVIYSRTVSASSEGQKNKTDKYDAAFSMIDPSTKKGTRTYSVTLKVTGSSGVSTGDKVVIGATVRALRYAWGKR